MGGTVGGDQPGACREEKYVTPCGSICRQLLYEGCTPFLASNVDNRRNPGSPHISGTMEFPGPHGASMFPRPVTRIWLDLTPN
jgi:hypothetical protein